VSAPERPFGVYVHYPYCAKRCPYCDFNVVQPGPEGRPDEPYRDAVLAELRARAPGFSGREGAVSLYFGGGTPALWAPECVAAVVEGVRAVVGLREGAEITLEANPHEADAARLRALRATGINRLSLGTQSFDDALLERLGRQNRRADNERCVRDAREAGFDNLSLDLIQGAAGQSLEAAMADVDAALALAPEHVSTYELTIHAGTPFGARARRGEVLTTDDDALADAWHATRGRLRDAGVQPYEISNAARPGREAVHNGLYWTMGEYLALGAGAHGFLRGPASTGGERWENERHAGRWMRAALSGKPAERFRETIDAETFAVERLLTGLRLEAGTWVPEDEVARFRAAFVVAEARGLLERTPSPRGSQGGERVRLTDRGRPLLDSIVADIWASAAPSG
jgi:oxygen-independent coproporphyrinogen-3 oxidase